MGVKRSGKGGDCTIKAGLARGGEAVIERGGQAS